MILKHIITFIFFSILFEAASAQEQTKIYFIKNPGSFVSTRDSADFILEIHPPDTALDKNLYIIKEFYPNGKLMLTSGSLTGSLSFKFQGSYISFFPNGHKRMIGNFEDGKLIGNVVEYYPNGKLYTVKNFITEKRVFLTQCNDSTGKVLSQNGKGDWVEFDDDFKLVTAEGQINYGLKNGEWRGKSSDSKYPLRVYVYKDGSIVASAIIDNDGNEYYDKAEVMPEYPGGIKEFGKFIADNLQYPFFAKKNGITGKVLVSFVVETDGTVGEVKVTKGIGSGCDGEAIRVVKLSPKWKPGSQNGKPVKFLYVNPIVFNLY